MKEYVSLSISEDNNNQLDPQAQEKSDDFISLVQEDPKKNWEQVIEKDNIMSIFLKIILGNPCQLVHTENLIKDFNANEIFVQIYNADQWNKVTKGFSVIDKIKI